MNLGSQTQAYFKSGWKILKVNSIMYRKSVERSQGWSDVMPSAETS